MEWLIMQGGGLHGTASNLGYKEGDTYIISDDCEDMLEEMMTDLCHENKITRPARKCFAASTLIQMDLLPILCASEDNPSVFRSVVKLVMNLSLPLEIILPVQASMSRENHETRDHLRKMLFAMKKSFVDRKIIKALIGNMITIVDENGSYQWTPDTVNTMESCLKLLRNILHIPTATPKINIDIVRHCFDEGLTQLLIDLCNNRDKASFVPIILQILCLVYRGLEPDILMNLVKVLPSMDLTNQAETTPTTCKLESKEDVNVKTEEDKDVFKKPPTPAEVQQEVIQLRMEMAKLALRFLKEAMSSVLLCLWENSMQTVFEDFHFLWAISYFLPLASLPGVQFSQIRHYISPPAFCTLTYVIMTTWESYTIAQTKSNDTHANLLFKRLQLLVSCLHKSFYIMHRFATDVSLSEKDTEQLKSTLLVLSRMKNVRDMFVLLIRKFTKELETMQYLKDLILTNDVLLKLVSSSNETQKEEHRFDMTAHISKFANKEVMLNYNCFLELYNKNTLQENEQAMNMFHHIAVDLDMPQMLCQIPILTTISEIWKQPEEYFSKDSYELIDYTIYSFCKFCMKDRQSFLESLKPQGYLKLTTRNKCMKRKQRVKKHKKKSKRPVHMDLTYMDTIVDNGLFVLPSKDISDSDSSDSHDEDETTNASSLTGVLERLRDEGFQQELQDLQCLLLEVCYIKLKCQKTEVGEPIPWNYCLRGSSVPIFAYTVKQEQMQENKSFQVLLRLLGLVSKADSHHLYPTIPSFWSAEMCFDTSKKIGSITEASLKFQLSEAGSPIEESEKQGGTEVAPSAYEDYYSYESSSPKNVSVRNHLLKMPCNSWLSFIQAANSELASK